MRQLLLLLGALGTGGAAAQVPPVETLDWLAGCWAADGAEAGSGERWTPPAGGTLLGLSRTVKGGRTVEWEFMRIVTEPDGRIAFIAQPSGQREARFERVASPPEAAVFENPAHDFPQRIIYRRQGADRLAARIEGTRGGVQRGIDFPLRRVDC
jgi:Domain of unknown function (DUF6265)